MAESKSYPLIVEYRRSTSALQGSTMPRELFVFSIGSPQRERESVGSLSDTFANNPFVYKDDGGCVFCCCCCFYFGSSVLPLIIGINNNLFFFFFLHHDCYYYFLFFF